MRKKERELRERDERAVKFLRAYLTDEPRGLVATADVMRIVRNADGINRPPHGGRARRLVREAFPSARPPRLQTITKGVRGLYWEGITLQARPLVRPQPRIRKPGEYSVRLRKPPTERRGRKRYR